MPFIDRSSKKFKILSLSVIVIILAVTVKAFFDNWHRIRFDELKFNPGLFIVSLILSVIISALSAWLWQYTLLLLGERPRLVHAWRITVYSQIVRYIPGKVWQYMGKIYWGRKAGLSNKKIVLSTLLETIFLMSGSFVASLFCLPIFIRKEYVSWEFLLPVSILLSGMIFLLNPRIIEKTINTFGKKWIKNPVALHFSYRHILVLVLLYALVWMLMGLQLHVLVNSLYSLHISNYLYLASLNALSWLIGFLSIITPSGLGVKEGIFILGFKAVVPVSFAIIVALLIRLYTIFADVVITAVFFMFDRSAWRNLIDFRNSSHGFNTENIDEKGA